MDENAVFLVCLDNCFFIKYMNNDLLNRSSKFAACFELGNFLGFDFD